MSPLYFAYGSNLKQARLRRRIGACQALGRASLPGHRLCFDKPGRDGSAKANLCAAEDEQVWGVLYELDEAAFGRLDPFEGGYERVRVEVRTDDGGLRAALTYRSRLSDVSRLPFGWYRDLLVEGGREHGLPAAYLERIAALPVRADPRRDRKP